MGDDEGDDEKEAGFGMTYARVTHARDTDARDDARADACRRFIEATRARMPPPSRRRRRRRRARARVGDDGGGRRGGDDERQAGFRDDARASDARGRLTGVRNNAR